MSIVVAMLIFGLIVFIHELGHFLFARRAGIMVEEFAIGMGPQIAGIKRGDTNYSIRVIPFGGYCKMLGEDENAVAEDQEATTDKPNDIDQDTLESQKEPVDMIEPYQMTEAEIKAAAAKKAFEEEKYYSQKTVGQRFSVIFAGPLFNFILAFLFALVYLYIAGDASRVIIEVPEDQPAYEAGIRAGDVLVGFNDRHILSAKELMLYLNNERPEVAEITVKRPGPDGVEKMTFVISPSITPEGIYRIGIRFDMLDTSSPIVLITSAAKEVVYWIKMVIYSLGMLISGGASGKDVAGPVGLVGFISEGYEESVEYGMTAVIAQLSFYIVFLSANLGVMNLLPIPALDGGRLVFIAIEAIRGKPVDPDKEGRVHFIGFMILMGLMVLVLYNDIARLFTR